MDPPIPNMNFVSGATFRGNNSNIHYAGKTPSAAACSNLCFANTQCRAFTWHDGDQPKGSTQWDDMCYHVLITGAAYVHRTQTHHTSGTKHVPPVAQNVWVSRGAVDVRDAMAAAEASREKAETANVDANANAGRNGSANGNSNDNAKADRGAMHRAETVLSFEEAGATAGNRVNGISALTGLRVNGKRAIRARWPNGDPEYQLFPEGWVMPPGSAWAKPRSFPTPAAEVVVRAPNRSALGPCDSNEGYCNYITGVGGACAGYGFEPPSGYWCAPSPPRGKSYTTSFPAGLTAGPAAFDGRTWSHYKVCVCVSVCECVCVKCVCVSVCVCGCYIHA